MQSLAQMRSQTFNTTDATSIISNNNTRKSSRLSNFNPIGRSRTLPRYEEAAVGQPVTSSNASVVSGVAPAPATAPESISTLHSNVSSSSLGSGENNYQLVKMDTNNSISSDFSIQSQFKVSLRMTKKEIELIRYTWNKMLLDEPIEQKQTPYGMPGGFNTNITPSTAGSKEKTMNYINRTSASTVASSLFCRQFYSNLLSMDSNLEKLFPSIKHQAVSFAGVMSFAISQLENLTVLDDYLINLGKRHSRILGIEPANFELMGEALIQTFHERFGTRFTQELEVLWIKLYLYLANSLLQFGIDPVIRLNEDDDELYDTASVSNMNQSFFWGGKSRTYSNLNSSADFSSSSMLMDDKRSSISTAATGTTGMTGATTIMSSVASTATAASTIDNKKQLPAVPAGGLGVPAAKKASIKKRKRDCVIM